MGRLVVEQIVSANGTAVDEHGGLGFVPPPDEHDPGEDREQLARYADLQAIVLGATTYRMFAGYWPERSAEDEPIAPLINRVCKYVVSSSLREAPWGSHQPAVVERGSAEHVLRELKHRCDGELVLWGSLSLTDAAFRAGLVDVLRLRIVPTLLGGGRGVVPADLALTGLRLVSSHVHPGGQVTSEYRVLSEPPASPGEPGPSA